MIRLYKRGADGKALAYHEAWVEPENRRIVEHWGLLGEEGETDTYRIKLLGSLKKQFNSVLDPARGEGFTEISEGDLDQAATTGGVAMLLPAVQSARESYSSPPKKKSWIPWNLW